MAIFAWVVLSAMQAAAYDSVVVFNEINYHPAAGQAEFIELRNLQGVDMNVGGWTIDGGVDFKIPSGTIIPGGGYLTIGAVPGAIGNFTGSLNNSGETLNLRNLTGRIMDQLSYSDAGDWPVGPDGSGVTLARKAANAIPTADAWTTSAEVGGTPGAANFVPVGVPITSSAVPLADTWKYDASGVASPAGWTAPAFDDSAWPAGVAPFYFGNPAPSASPASPVTSVGSWSVERWTGDADSQISSAKTYTHKVDLGHSGTPTVINGVTFTAPGAARSDTNWSLTGATSNLTTNTTAPRNPMLAGSGSFQLLTEFDYDGTQAATEVLQLTGLVPEQTYILTLYVSCWDTNREFRRDQITPDNSGVPVILDQSAGAQGKGLLVKYQYKATSSSLSVSFKPLSPANWHQYAFTNEVAPAMQAERQIAPAGVESVSSAFTNRAATFTGDGSGLTALGDHGTIADGAMWQTNGTAAVPNDPLPADITWTLPAPATLSGLRIWNYNELLSPQGPVTDNTPRGAKNIEVFVSPDAAGETFSSVGTFILPQALGSTSEVGTRLAFASTQTGVRRVRLVASTNWGDGQGIVGLSEVRFLSPGTLLPANPITTRFRKNFTVSGAASSIYTLNLQHGVDDGAVFYLNGTEVYRTNLTGAVTSATPADTEILIPKLVSVPLPSSALVRGANTLAVELHQAASGANDAWFTAALDVTETPQAQTGGFQWSEITGAADAAFYIELVNPTASPLSTAGWTISTSDGHSYALASQLIPAGGFLAIDAATLGFTPADGTKLFLFAPGGSHLSDARAVTTRRHGLLADGSWGLTTSATPGAANVAVIERSVVINEIFYHAPGNSAEQWVELYNRGTTAVDLSGWQFSGGVGYTFPASTTIPADGYLVIAWNPAAFAALHPGVTALGPWSGALSGGGERIELSDSFGNVVNAVTYADGGRWTKWADGGGSSLELIDPFADNSRGEAWAASDESSKAPWQTISYEGSGANPGPTSNDPTTWNEFVIGLLSDGEFLIDDVSVQDKTAGTGELIQNGNFSNGVAAWRVIGNHHGAIVDDPTSAGNSVLKIATNGATEHMANHAETTLKSGATYPIIDGTHQYSISLRAKWLRGSNRLHTRLYCNRLARQTLLPMPATGGTPGARNGSRVVNAGPTFDRLSHSPEVPPVGSPATVRVQVGDNDGIGDVQLFTSVNGAAFTSAPMSAAGGGFFTGTIPGQSSGALVQFYVRATDTLGAVSFFPAGGPASRAIIPWNDGRAQLTLATGVHPHNLRVIITTADANEFYKPEKVMSNDVIPCTVIFDEQEVYYRAGVRLKSSEHGRYDSNRVGFIVEFGSDELFLGAHGAISIDRSGGTGTGQSEILLKAFTNAAGGVYATEDDIIRVIAPVATSSFAAFSGTTVTGPALLSKSRFDDEFLDGQFTDGGSGPLFKFDLIYVLTQTIDPNTRVVGTLPENPKIPQSGAEHPGVNVGSLGTDKEVYRWHYLLKNAHGDDNYVPLFNGVTAIGQVGGTAAFKSQTTQYVDINNWLRACIPAVLFGVQDNYLGTSTGQHNTYFYFPPGGKMTLIPWDLDYLNQSNSQASLTTGGDLTKFLADPINKRLYYGYMLNVVNRSFNTAYLTRWAQHYSKFSVDDMTAMLSFLSARATYATNVINGTAGQTAPIPPVSFARTSPSPVSVTTSFATISGTGWINVAEIRLQGNATSLPVTWTSDTAWTLQLPVAPGTNTYNLFAYDADGGQIGSASVVVNGSGGIFAAGPGNLLVSELNYNPPSADDLTEFIELVNVTGSTLDLSGCHFDEEAGQGIAYTFPGGVQLAAGARIVVVRDQAAFVAQYGSGLNVAPGTFTGALDNKGETIVLYAAGGSVIFRFSYTDAISSTDGGGKTLVRVISSTNPNPNDYTWRASVADGGSPGTSDAVAFTGSMSADGDGDGQTALLEYSLGTSDLVANPGPLRIGRDQSGNLILNFTRNLAADDVVLTIETSAAPDGPWAPANATKTGSVVSGSLAGETWQIAPPSPGAPLFARLKATLH